MQYAINNRWTGKPICTVKIDCAEDAPPSKKLGLAVVAAVRDGISLRDADLREADLQGTWLRDADLQGVDLWGADLRDARLWDSNLRGVDLREAKLLGADLQGADLRGAKMRGVDLRGVDLRGVDLRGAWLQGAWLLDSNLQGTDLREADLREVKLLGADLQGCIGNTRHIKSMQIDRWPVTYTHDTLQIGCQVHPIEEWRKWNDNEKTRDWIDSMDDKALNWADRHLDLVLSIIDASPARGPEE